MIESYDAAEEVTAAGEIDERSRETGRAHPHDLINLVVVDRLSVPPDPVL
ncbi:hypothetical protein OSC27_10880 [Microbacterium sp. STN6]|nr:hypothetical protein [Microbacterium sp. STN6]MCX7522777.1 hypothetical protein [Microbacterium sp. STN6]